MSKGRKKNENEESNRCYIINICDGYYAMKDKYCYTLYYTRNKRSTPLKPDVDESETTQQVLGYYTDFNNMLLSIAKHKVDVLGLKSGVIDLKQYIQSFNEIKDEILNIAKV